MKLATIVDPTFEIVGCARWRPSSYGLKNKQTQNKRASLSSCSLHKNLSKAKKCCRKNGRTRRHICFHNSVKRSFPIVYSFNLTHMQLLFSSVGAIFILLRHQSESLRSYMRSMCMLIWSLQCLLSGQSTCYCTEQNLILTRAAISIFA